MLQAYAPGPFQLPGLRTHLHVRLRRAARTTVPVAVDVVQGAIEVFVDGLQQATGGIIDQSRVTKQR